MTFACHTRFRLCVTSLNQVIQGPVVQSIVSLTSWLRGELVKCFTTFTRNTDIFVGKMREAFALLVLTFFNKNIGIFEILTIEILTKR